MCAIRRSGNAVAILAGSANGGLIVTGSASASVQHDLIIALAAKYKLPAVYAYSYMVTSGCLTPPLWIYLVYQYGVRPATSIAFSRAHKLAHSPFQAPTKYELVINLRTAKALGLTVPQGLQASADQVIE